jgi:tetratricopeptide (TPR) repeat protein
MARGALKNLPRRRPAERLKDNATAVDQLNGGTLLDDLDPLGGWLNCECLFSFSLVLVLLLAALPFNLYSSDVYQTRESFVLKAEEHFSAGHYDAAATLYEKAVRADETADGRVFLADTLVRVGRAGDAVAHYQRAADLYDDEREKAAALMRYTGPLSAVVSFFSLLIEVG